MDVQKIQAAISSMAGVKVQGGKNYTMVAQRVEAFRNHVGADLGIETELVVNDGKTVLIKAFIKDKSGFTVSSGYAEEIRGSTNINKGAAIENCETSAVGRALAALGLHGGEYASGNEIEKHQRNVDAQDTHHDVAPVKPSFDEPPLNAKNDSDWRMWVDKQKAFIKGSTEVYQIKKWATDTTAEREALQEYSRELTAELKDFYQQHWENINNGERR